MELPAGSSCGSCRNFPLCSIVVRVEATRSYCDWFPRRYLPTVPSIPLGDTMRRPVLPIDDLSGVCPDPVFPPPTAHAAALLLLSDDPAELRAILRTEAADAECDGRESFSSLLGFIYGNVPKVLADYEFAEEQLTMAGYLAEPGVRSCQAASWRTPRGQRLFDAVLAPDGDA